ncbi:hypothetical protein EGW08_018208, partial [Elysia chlorotica]
MVHRCYLHFFKVLLVFYFKSNAIVYGAMESSSDSTLLFIPKLKNISKHKEDPGSRVGGVYETLPRNKCHSCPKHAVNIMHDEATRLKIEKPRGGFQETKRKRDQTQNHLQRYRQQLTRIAKRKLKHLRSKRQSESGDPSGSRQRLLARTVHARFNEMLIHCLPSSQASAVKGYFRIHQNNTFEL